MHLRNEGGIWGISDLPVEAGGPCCIGNGELQKVVERESGIVQALLLEDLAPHPVEDGIGGGEQQGDCEVASGCGPGEGG